MRKGNTFAGWERAIKVMALKESEIATFNYTDIYNALEELGVDFEHVREGDWDRIARKFCVKLDTATKGLMRKAIVESGVVQKKQGKWRLIFGKADETEEERKYPHCYSTYDAEDAACTEGLCICADKCQGKTYTLEQSILGVDVEG